jgi:hypothetical protein
MAYMSTERKQERAPAIKAVLKKYGVKGSLSVRNHSTLVLTIKSGSIDFIGNSNRVCGASHYQVASGFQPNTRGYSDVNPYHYQSHFDGKALKFLSEILPLMYGSDYFDHSDAQTDYFHCSHYVDVNIGKWDKPYILGK